MRASVSKSHNLRRDERGNVAILFALSLFPLLALTGLAVDGWRTLNAATLAQGAIDAAALAAAKAMNENGASEAELARVARTYFDANTAGTHAMTATFSGIDVRADRRTGAVDVTVEVTVPTTFSQILGYDAMRLARTATAVYKTSDVELAMMLDITGSMQGAKLRDLQIAAKDLVDLVVPEGRAAEKVRVALAPYAAAVNAGRYAARVSDGKSRDNCVVERSASAYEDAAPARGRYLGAYPDASLPANGNYNCPRSEIVPLTSDKAQLKSEIDRFRAGGWTAGHLGTAWAWYLVSPNWADIWPAASRPAAYGTRDLIKAVVLMTDGEYNTSYANGRVNQTSNTQARALCDEMKRKKVVVYTVGFDLREREAIRTLETCASVSTNFYLADNGEELRRAFRDIGSKLTTLRLSQ